MTADADFLDRLDSAIGCQHCGGPLGESPSDDFCSPAHQRVWHEQHAQPLPWSPDAARVYVGEDDQPVPLTEPGVFPPSLQRFDELIAAFARATRPAPRITVDTSGAEAALRAVGQAFDQSVGSFARAYLNATRHPTVTGDPPGTRRGRQVRGQQVTWSEMDETQRLWTTENCGTVHRYEAGHDHGERREPTPRDVALQARRNRNTGPPAGRMDGRRGRGGPRR